MGIIYCFTFKSGKKYIGMTSEAMGRRLAVHRMSLKWSQAAVYRAWRKYGDPEIIILAEHEVDKLREAEREAIAFHNTMVPNGYNLVSGGEGALAVAEETRIKLSLAKKGKKPSALCVQKLIERNKVQTWNNGRKQTAEHNEKRAAANRGKKRSQEFRDRMSVVAKSRVMSAETKAKIAATMRIRRQGEFWSTKKHGS